MFAIETANSELMPLSLIVTFLSKGFPYRCPFEEFIIAVIYFCILMSLSVVFIG